MSAHPPAAASPAGVPPPSPGGLPRATPAAQTTLSPQLKKVINWLLIGILVVAAAVVIRWTFFSEKKDELPSQQVVLADNGTSRTSAPVYVHVPSSQTSAVTSSSPSPAPATKAPWTPPTSSPWGAPFPVPPMSSGTESEAVPIPPGSTIYRKVSGPYRVSSCHDLLQGWLSQEICPNGADFERYQMLGEKSGTASVRYEPA